MNSASNLKCSFSKSETKQLRNKDVRQRNTHVWSVKLLNWHTCGERTVVCTQIVSWRSSHESAPSLQRACMHNSAHTAHTHARTRIHTVFYKTYQLRHSLPFVFKSHSIHVRTWHLPQTEKAARRPEEASLSPLSFPVCVCADAHVCFSGANRFWCFVWRQDLSLVSCPANQVYARLHHPALGLGLQISALLSFKRNTLTYSLVI